jgi:hypothetical protein
LLRAEAVEARIVASYSSPQGITGRIQSIRLRRHFHPTISSRSQSKTTIGNGSPEWHHEHSELLSNFHIPNHNLDPHFTPDLSRNLEVAANPLSPEQVGHDKRTASGNGTKVSKVVPWHVAAASYAELGPISRHLCTSEDLWEALRSGDSFAILQAASGVAEASGHDASVFKSIPPTTFSEILRCLDPKNFVGRYIDLFKMIPSRRNATYPGLQSQKFDMVMMFSATFMSHIQDILSARQAAGFKLGIQEYKYLLRCAKNVGDKEAADAIWTAMENDGLKLDTECYNLYLAALAWSDLILPSFRYAVRVTPSNLNARSWSLPPWRLRGHMVGTNKTVKTIANITFNKMLQEGIMGDEETFCTLMVTQAREGDVTGIKAILRRVWGVDVDGLLQHGEEHTQPVKHYPLDSPFRPSQELLMAVAHVFGINNAVPTALQVVDFISRQYSIPISEKVWEELLERTFVLSSKRSANVDKVGDKIGQMPRKSVIDLWNTLTNKPYNIKPTINMYDMLISRLLTLAEHSAAEDKMWEVRKKHVARVKKYHRSLGRYRCMSLCSSTPWRRLQISAMERNLRYTYLMIHRSRHYIRKWVSNYISNSRHLIFRNFAFNAPRHFTTRELTGFLYSWFSYLPRTVRYETPTGMVSFMTGSHGSNNRHAMTMQLRVARRPLLLRSRIIRRRCRD